MQAQGTDSQLPYASVDTGSGVRLAPRLALDDVDLADAVAHVLAQCGAATMDPSAPAPLTGLAGDIPDVLDASVETSWLLFVDLAAESMRLGGSLFMQTLAMQAGPDLEPSPTPADPDRLHALGEALQACASAGTLLACRPRAAGGLMACVATMAAAGDMAVPLNIDPLLIEGHGDGRMDSGEAKDWTTQVSGLRHELTLRALFNEEAGVVLQVTHAQRSAVLRELRAHGLGRHSHFIARLHGGSASRGDGSTSAADDAVATAQLSVWRDTRAVYAAALSSLPLAGADNAGN